MATLRKPIFASDLNVNEEHAFSIRNEPAITSGGTALYSDLFSYPGSVQRVSYVLQDTLWLLLNDTEELYVSDENRVRNFLSLYRYLQVLIEKAVRILPEYFPNTRLEITVIDDPEEPDAEGIGILVHTEMDVDEARQQMDAFGNGWWFGHVGETQGRLGIHLEF